MKKNLKTTPLLFFVIISIFMNGCTNDDTITAQKKQPLSTGLSNTQLASMQAQADKVAKEAVAQINSGANKRNTTGTDLVELNVTTVTPTGPISATYGFSMGIRNPALLDPSMLTTYNYTFCAAVSHTRFAYVYVYNGDTHTATIIGTITGSVGGCLTGSRNYSVNMAGPNTSQSFVVVFDVYNGPGSSPAQIAGPIWSNTRDLTYPNHYVTNNGYYWY